MGLKKFWVDKVDSTNDLAKSWVREGKTDADFVVVANEQTSGRGQYSRSWVTTPGMNLTFTYYACELGLAGGDQFYLSKATANAVHEYLNSKEVHAQIKWPNDILVGNAKICGLLIENFLRSNVINEAVIGIGLNVNQVNFSDSINGTSLKDILSDDFDLKDELELLLTHLDRWFGRVRLKAYSRIDEYYSKYLYGINSSISVQVEGAQMQGTIKKVLPDGKIVIEMTDGVTASYNQQQLKLLI